MRILPSVGISRGDSVFWVGQYKAKISAQEIPCRLQLE
jgi:hypothetical protein